MEYEMMRYLIFGLGLCGTMVLILYLHKKGLRWLALLFVSIIEAICDFMKLNGYGEKKYEFVKMILLIISPKLSNEQIDTLIEDMVKKMKEIKGAI